MQDPKAPESRQFENVAGVFPLQLAHKIVRF